MSKYKPNEDYIEREAMPEDVQQHLRDALEQGIVNNAAIVVVVNGKTHQVLASNSNTGVWSMILLEALQGAVEDATTTEH